MELVIFGFVLIAFVVATIGVLRKWAKPIIVAAVGFMAYLVIHYLRQWLAGGL